MPRDAGQVVAFREQAESCPIPAAVALIGERWTCLILRASMLGLRNFEEFQACLGIARNILSDRLGRLVTAGILARAPDPDDRRKVVYSLTQRGAELLPVMAALRQWALDAGLGKPAHPTLADKRDRKPVARLTVHAHDGRPVSMEDLIWIGADGEELAMPPITKGTAQSEAA
jgi:DNA-binding HxlR family transcriptional regulator